MAFIYSGIILIKIENWWRNNRKNSKGKYVIFCAVKDVNYLINIKFGFPCGI